MLHISTIFSANHRSHVSSHVPLRHFDPWASSSSAHANFGGHLCMWVSTFRVFSPLLFCFFLFPAFFFLQCFDGARGHFWGSGISGYLSQGGFEQRKTLHRYFNDDSFNIEDPTLTPDEMRFFLKEKICISRLELAIVYGDNGSVKTRGVNLRISSRK